MFGAEYQTFKLLEEILSKPSDNVRYRRMS